MKKSNFVTLVMGVVSGILFAIGTCAALIPEWGAFRPGIVLGCIGLGMGLLTVFVWRKMEGKAPARLTGKAILIAGVGTLGVLGLGVGMCLSMVWHQLIPGMVVGIFGIMVLLCLVPLKKGWKVQ